MRNDKIGDFMLAWPSLALLRAALPAGEIHALVPRYTRELAEACPWIDAVVEDPGPEAGGRALRGLAAELRRRRFDAALTLFSTTRIGIALAAARIPYRLAPATKIAQVFHNRRLRQRRSRSEKPEYAYNLDLARRLLADHGVAPPPDPRPPVWRLPAAETAGLDRRLRTAHGIAPEARIVVLHPGSGGSAANLAPAQYAELARRLQPAFPVHFLVTAGPGEEAGAEALARRLRGDGLAASALPPRAGLVDFARHLALAALFIGGSTGPLHIAGALDVPTAAFYPRRRSATPLRWQTLNSPGRRLAFTPPHGAPEEDMGRIDLAAAARAISAHFLR